MPEVELLYYMFISERVCVEYISVPKGEATNSVVHLQMLVVKNASKRTEKVSFVGVL